MIIYYFFYGEKMNRLKKIRVQRKKLKMIKQEIIVNSMGCIWEIVKVIIKNKTDMKEVK